MRCSNLAFLSQLMSCCCSCVDCTADDKTAADAAAARILRSAAAASVNVRLLGGRLPEQKLISYAGIYMY